MLEANAISELTCIAGGFRLLTNPPFSGGFLSYILDF